ncbi:DUF881 domain-containing protein [Streptomyces sp. DSM 41886]|uniref:DUF881 domain-containing protein n=2 Tax=Streptomyces johnsoniae TaxID=3075532 RepID=A0ABU2S3I9_9ACTN|nr:DUF881 domain-containing protein [Streptomyces sp. DSM 41886]MDT0442640.1 DUF881 domain-containing protein [Streptomyces sp. DSM 41886]
MCAMPQQEPGRRVPARPDASMSLLTTVMSNTLDEGYAAAGRRSAGRSELPRTLRARLWLAGGLALAAVVVTLGAAQAREAEPTLARGREELLDRVEARTAELDDLQEEVDALRADVDERQRDAIGDARSAAGELTALLAGATAVTGPGIELVVNDAEGAAPGAGGPRDAGFADTGRVRDRDLQRVVNGLWQAGAEAISVNGRRLTALSAIRAAGDAVLVDNRPLAPPYTLLAIGPGDELAAAFRATAEGRYLDVLREDYGIRAGTTVHDRLELPAAPGLTTHTAGPAAAPETQPEDQPEEGGAP